MSEELVVYTVVMGEERRVAKAFRVEGVEWVIISDIPGFYSAGWTTLETARLIEFDSPRSSRHPKFFPIDYFPDHPRSLYIDSNVILWQDPRALWAHLIGKSGDTCFGAAYQSFRQTLQDEFQAVRDLRLEKPAVIEELHELYLSLYPDSLAERVT